MKTRTISLLLMACLSSLPLQMFAQTETEPKTEPQQTQTQPRRADATVLEEKKWRQVDASLKRGLAWLATQQKTDGSFDSMEMAQPAVTSFCLMAFMAQGESPADGRYQKQLASAINFIARQQKPNGLIATIAPQEVPIRRAGLTKFVSQNSAYNHAISGLALTEAYGQCSPAQAERLSPVIEKAIAATLEMQSWEPKHEKDKGGWRYLGVDFAEADSDLSITGWQLMFLRSAKNAGFDVPLKSIDAAVGYVESCFLKDAGGLKVHAYLANNPQTCTRAMAGAGVLAMAHAGKHESEQALASGEWILKHNFKKYNDDSPIYNLPWCEEHYHYASFLCSQAMFHLGGKYWKQFFPPLVETLLANQQKDGAWPPEKAEVQFGRCYSTSLCILSLSVPNQMLPILQR